MLMHVSFCFRPSAAQAASDSSEGLCLVNGVEPRQLGELSFKEDVQTNKGVQNFRTCSSSLIHLR